MDINQKSFIITGIVFIELLILLYAIVLVIKDVITGYRNKDASKYRIALIKFSISIALIFMIGIVQFYIILK